MSFRPEVCFIGPVLSIRVHVTVFLSTCRQFGNACRYASSEPLCASAYRWDRAPLPLLQEGTPSVGTTRHTQSLSHPAAFCWFCGEALQTASLLTCPNCGYVQKIREELNYFQLFGLCVPSSIVPFPTHSLYSEHYHQTPRHNLLITTALRMLVSYVLF